MTRPQVTILLAASSASGLGEVVRVCARLSGVKENYLVRASDWPPPAPAGPVVAAPNVLDGREGHDDLDGLFDVWRARSNITAVRSCAAKSFCSWLRETGSRHWLLEEAFCVRVGIVVSPSDPEMRRACSLAASVQYYLGPTEPPVVVTNDVRRLGPERVRNVLSRWRDTAFRIQHVPACSSPLALEQIANGGYLTDLLPDTDQFAQEAVDADASERVLRWWEVASNELKPVIPSSSEPVIVGQNTRSLRNTLRSRARTTRRDKEVDKLIDLGRDPDIYRVLVRRVLRKFV